MTNKNAASPDGNLIEHRIEIAFLKNGTEAGRTVVQDGGYFSFQNGDDYFKITVHKVKRSSTEWQLVVYNKGKNMNSILKIGELHGQAGAIWNVKELVPLFDEFKFISVSETPVK
ncbi:MAG: hypothetical protein AUJ47_13265 [Candidatus Marinimicrobia bacterium CG1_02_48_14]|nr:MAG: hypothetical protein AUJ47_13265 [Candidatus Marinimicrobia bacterium CG1_02_48_14]PIZ63975.1 MAG: hypothetical protein COY19_09460 [Candidatus Marinimicrobia bacterium CG_4_10_14_0_2_um_filter_48_9]PJA52457.1 MAG: hypothetical protein CO167_08840 [Candidatus Marinimicrobia bacterium CG_4_9_14_3_um_filter_48_9]